MSYTNHSHDEDDYNDYVCHDRLGSDYYPIMMNWNTSIDCCNWDGVTCKPFTGDVVSLDLSCGMLRGTIHPNSTLFNLPHLQTLNLAYNTLTNSQLPREIGRFYNSLTHLNISDSGFIGQVPTDITILPKLVSLDLSWNDLKLEPQVFYNLLHNSSSLEEISLDGVNISSSLPVYLNISSSMKSLHLYRTGLFGILPDNIFNLPYLEELVLSYNYDLTGRLPKVYTNTSIPLKLLALSNTNLSGEIPDSISHLKYLNYLDLHSNLFHGAFPLSICNMSYLWYLDMSNNRFGGVIPQCLGNINSHLVMVDLGNNSFNGTITNEWDNCGGLEGLLLNGNSLEGEVPSGLSNCKSLKVLDLGNNHLNDTFPHWSANLQHLQVLVLKSNKLHGSIESSSIIKHPFSSLKVLDLSRNKFVGNLSGKYFQNFDAMKEGVKKGGKPKYLSIGKFYSITIAVKGSELPFPRILVDYTIVDLSSNIFEGEIPNVIGSLISLIVLNLSHNSLNGQIPYVLGNLQEIESLDLSCNQLTGEIPQSLAVITNLEALNLSKNHLVGRIPDGAQFKTFGAASFEGNPGLCGFPLPNCEHPSPAQLEVDGDEESGLTWKVVMLGYGCGTLLGMAMGYIMLSTGRPKWFNRIADDIEYMILARLKKRRYVYIGK